MISVGTGDCQHYFVHHLSSVSPQARGTSVKSTLIQSVRKGMLGKFMSFWGTWLRSSPAIFTGQGQINRVIPVSECLWGIVGSSLLEKELDDNSNTSKFGRASRWWRRCSLENLYKFIIYNQCGYTNKQTNKINNPHTPHFGHLSISIQFLSLFYGWLVKMCW